MTEQQKQEEFDYGYNAHIQGHPLNTAWSKYKQDGWRYRESLYGKAEDDEAED